MRLLIKNNPEDTLLLGVIRNISLGIITVIIQYFFIFTVFLFITEKNKVWSIFFYIFALPLSFIVSGIYNGIILMKSSCPKAAKINLVIAFLIMLVGVPVMNNLFKT